MQSSQRKSRGRSSKIARSFRRGGVTRQFVKEFLDVRVTVVIVVAVRGVRIERVQFMRLLPFIGNSVAARFDFRSSAFDLTEAAHLRGITDRFAALTQRSQVINKCLV